MTKKELFNLLSGLPDDVIVKVVNPEYLPTVYSPVTGIAYCPNEHTVEIYTDAD